MTDEEQKIVQTDLKKIFALEQGVPVAVGSGKSSLKYKLRATSHSVKLNCKTWRRTAEQLTHTATWVGDLGEMGVCNIKSNLRSIIGDWIEEADASDVVANVADDEFGIVGQDMCFPSPSKKCLPLTSVRVNCADAFACRLSHSPREVRCSRLLFSAGCGNHVRTIVLWLESLIPMWMSQLCHRQQTHTPSICLAPCILLAPITF